MLENFVSVLLELTAEWGYLGVFVLMTVESSFIPFPSELVVPPAAYLAQQGELSLFWVIAAGIGGSMVGALVNYYLAFLLGRPLVYRLVESGPARFLLLSRVKLERAEAYFLKYGSLSTFVGRLIPVIRQLISLPAGFVRMPMPQFLIYTFLGSGLWTVILALQGYLIGQYQDIVVQYLYQIIGGIVFAGVAVYAFFRYLRRRTYRRASE